LVKYPLTVCAGGSGPFSGLPAGPGGQFGSHAAVERAANLEPPLVALPVAREERRLGLLARPLGSGEAVLGEVAQRGVEHRVARADAAVVVRRKPAGLADLARAHSRSESGRRGGKAN